METAGGGAPVDGNAGGAQRGSSTPSPKDGAGRPGVGGRNGAGERIAQGKKIKPLHAMRSKFRTYVVPECTEATEHERSSTDSRSEVDEAGIEHVCDYETSQQRVPTVMPHENPGFDIKSTDTDGFIARYIEVKSCSGEWDADGVAISKTQFEDAQTHGDVHWLYIVEKANSPDFRIFRIQDPARRVTEFLYDDGWRAVAETEVESTTIDVPESGEDTEVIR